MRDTSDKRSVAEPYGCSHAEPYGGSQEGPYGGSHAQPYGAHGQSPSKAAACRDGRSRAVNIFEIHGNIL